MNLHITLCLILLPFLACTLGPANELLTGEVIPPAIGLQPATQAKDIVGGYLHVCAHLDNDTMKCWGSNPDGQLNLKAARNASKKLYDISNARFTKISAGSRHTCGILKDAPLEGIPVCFGMEGEWLDVPHEKVKDISSGSDMTCFIKNDDKLACVGSEISFSNNLFNHAHIKADAIIIHGIDPISGAENQNYSEMKFKNVKAGKGKVCAQAADNEIIYCMGGNERNSGQLTPQPVLDYAPGDDVTSRFILKNGNLLMIGAIFGFRPITNITNPGAKFFKKIFDSNSGTGYLLAAGNQYKDNSPIPENTLITDLGYLEEGVLGVVFSNTSILAHSPGVICLLKTNHKVKCQEHMTTEITTHTSLIDDIPKEIAY